MSGFDASSHLSAAFGYLKCAQELSEVPLDKRTKEITATIERCYSEHDRIMREYEEIKGHEDKGNASYDPDGHLREGVKGPGPEWK